MGDQIAFEKMVAETQKTVFSIINGYVRDHATAEDLCQETYLKAFAGIDNLRDQSKLKPWLYTIARNTAITWITKNQQTTKKQKELASQLDTEQSQIDERIKILSQALNELRPEEREILTMRYSGNLSYKEISEALGMTVSSVGEKLSRLRDKLEEKLKLLFKDLL